MTHILVVGNTHDNPTAINQMVTRGDYLMLNEVRAGADQALTRPGWRSFHPTGAAHQNPHMWRTSKVEVLATSAHTIMQGGRVGLQFARVSRAMKRKFRGRRLGPSRGCSVCVVRQTADDQRGIYVDVHLAAGAFTFAKWRRFVHRASVERLAQILTTLERKYPGVPIIVGGDGNDPNRWEGMPGRYTRMKTLPDMGRQHYTQLYVNHNGGRADITGITEQRNASDHDAVIATVNFREAA